MSSSLVRSSRIASSSSRAIASGHHAAPAARIGSRPSAGGDSGAETVIVALRARAVDRARRRARSGSRQSSTVRASGVSATPFASGRPVARRGERQRALLHRLRELLRLGVAVDQAPLLRALRAHAFDQRAEDVGVVAAHVALVGEAREAAGAGQHAEQRHLGQAHRRRAVVDQADLVAGERQLVAAAGGRAVARGDELEPGVAARVLDAVARLVGELAEVHLPRVRRGARA